MPLNLLALEASSTSIDVIFLTDINYESISNLLTDNTLTVDAAELQGLLAGMLSGGMSLSDREWQNAIADMLNAGEPLPQAVSSIADEVFAQLCQQMLDSDFALQLCLPDDDSPINERGAALINYVQGFMAGFGLHQNDLSQCSDDVKEALEDFSEIARMEDAMNDDEESEQALFEVQEYVRISTMLCFNELGHSPLDDAEAPPTVH
jgi:yecA family protein